MKKPLIISLAMGAFMVVAGVLAMVMTPTLMRTGQQDKLNLETAVPGEFNDWKIDQSRASLLINPEVKGELRKIYSQTLSRTYINSQGERVMLAIAYGADQSTDMHVHRPELCYTASGFDVGKMTKTFVDTTIGQIPVMRLVAKQGMRNEPITYWIRVGDSLTRGWLEQKLTAIGYGLTGKVPDGLLFRVSTITNDEQDSYRIQQAFITDLIKAMPSEDQHWLVGKLH